MTVYPQKYDADAAALCPWCAKGNNPTNAVLGSPRTLIHDIFHSHGGISTRLCEANNLRWAKIKLAVDQTTPPPRS